MRLVMLAALLRLADACHEDQSRAPGRLMAKYISLGMPADAAKHWQRAKLIKAVDFDHDNRRILVTGECPKPFDFGLGKFDLGEVVEIVRQSIEKELRSVQQVLLPYPNTYFGEVRATIYTPVHLELNEEKQRLAVWPYLLDKPSSSTEFAAALVQMLLFAVEVGKKRRSLGSTWQDLILLPIMRKTQELRPFDFMITNLRRGIMEMLSNPCSDGESAEKLKSYLTDFLERIGENCHKMAQHAPGLLGRNDVLIIHGYSRNVATALQNLRGQGGHTLLVVTYDQPAGKVQLGPSQNDRTSALVREASFRQPKFLPLAAFAETLNDLQQQQLSCKVLLGTHGVLTKGNLHCDSFICKLGAYTLALIAHAAKTKGLDVETVFFSEERKFSSSTESNKENVGFEGPPAIRHSRGYPETANLKCAMPQVDFVSGELVDFIVTEHGAFEPDEIVFSGQ